MRKWNTFEEPSDKTLLEYDVIRYFFIGYFTQGSGWSELEKLANNFRDRDTHLVTELKESLRSLQVLLESNNHERWSEVEQFICEYSLKRLDFEDGQEFIDHVSRGLSR